MNEVRAYQIIIDLEIPLSEKRAKEITECVKRALKENNFWEDVCEIDLDW